MNFRVVYQLWVIDCFSVYNLVILDQPLMVYDGTWPNVR